mgnify:CR=1 FL=1
MTMRSLHQGAPLRGGLSETGGPMMPEPVLGERHAETIQQSHERCMTLGLNRTDRVDFPTLSRNELALARERNHRLYLHAAPVMETLFSQILDSQSMVVLTDANGTILHTIGPDAFLQRAAKVALSPGVNWSESTKGTNAIGTALIEELPTLVHGAEHFINANHFLTCSAAPILDPRGNILGVLDVTGDQHTFHPYTLGLVRMSVRMIENHWFSDDHRNVGHIYLHARPEFLGTLTEGILAVNPDGRIMGANRGAQEQLGMSSAALRMHTVTSLFGATMGALTERFRSTQAAPMLVETVSGRQLHLRARFNWPVWHSLSDTAADAVDRIVGLEIGADDYVPKPFELRELLARVRAVWRRLEVGEATHPAAQATPAEATKRVRFGTCWLDLDQRKLFGADDAEIALTAAEFDLLTLFARHPNRPLTRDQIMEQAHNRGWDVFDRSIDLRIMRLRRKIERNADKPEVIKTVRNVGYVYVPTPIDG